MYYRFSSNSDRNTGVFPRCEMIGKCKNLPCTNPDVTLSRVSGEGKKGKWREENCKNAFVLYGALPKQCGQSETEFPWNNIPESLRLERSPRSWSSTVTPSSI